MPRLMLYGSRLHDYAPYARGLRSGLAEWIILWMTRKRKLADCLSYSEHWINFHILAIIHAYNTGISRLRSHVRLRSKDMTSVIYDSGWKIWLRSYIPTPVVLPNSDRRHNFGCLSWLRLHITTLVNEHAACLTTSAVKDFVWPG
jgi:hypothetical protein